MTAPIVDFLLFKKRLVVGVLIINVCVFSLTGYSTYNSWQQQLRRIEVTSQNLVRALELSIAGIFDKVDVALLAVMYEAERELAAGKMTATAIDACISAHRDNIPELDNLRITDVHGDIRYGVFQQSASVVNVADRDYFITLRDHPQAGLFIAKPLLSRVNNKWIIVIARRINNPDGSFAGVVYGNILLDFFQRHFASFNLNKNGVITLRDNDLAIVARHPEAKGFGVGNKTVSQELSRLIRQGNKFGTYTNPGSIDPVQRIFSYRKISNYPLYINVGLATADYRNEWLNNAMKMFSLAALLGVGTLVMLRFNIRKWEQAQQASEELNLHRDHLETLVKERTSELETNNLDLAKEVEARRRFEAAIQEQTTLLFEQVDQRQQVQEELLLKQQQLAELNADLEWRVSDEVRKNREKDSILLHQDKLASIGQLAAGVAHEINNPMGFIMSNLRTLNNYADVEQQYLRALEEAFTRCCSAEQQVQFEELRTRLDLPFILEDVSPLISESLEGAERVRRIVLDLKDFARSDVDSMIETDLNNCVQSTANIVRNEIRYVAELELHLGTIPSVTCNPQQINQVIANLLMNAAQAIEEHGRITVTTSSEGDNVLLAVTDTGHGIPEKVRTRIFDPFFTTKEVGKGTGLGLSISYDIIKKHGGEIRVESEPGVGTTFTIILPINTLSQIPV